MIGRVARPFSSTSAERNLIMTEAGEIVFIVRRACCKYLNKVRILLRILSSRQSNFVAPVIGLNTSRDWEVIARTSRSRSP